MPEGGPGDSGVQYVLELADSFRKILGPQYDLVGFDPRGRHRQHKLYYVTVIHVS